MNLLLRLHHQLHTLFLAMEFQRLMTWLRIEVQLFCALAEANVLREIPKEKQERARNRTPVQDSVPQATTSMGINSNNLLDQVVDRMMGRMNSEVKRLESLIQQRPESILNIHNQSFATDRVQGPERTGYMNRHLRVVNFSGFETSQKRTHLCTGAPQLRAFRTLLP